MASPSSLCPGYKQVEEFGIDEDYEEEVTYVTLDLGSIEPTLVPSSSTYRLIGLDTPTPFLQLSGTILKGQHDSLLGTELLFADGKDSHDWNKRPVNHVANTEQRIGFKEVRLQPKKVPALQEASVAPSKKAKEKGKAKEATATETGGAAQEDDIQMLDRMTGKSGPLTRASRTRGEGSKSKKATKGKGRKKGSKDVEALGGDIISGGGQAGPGPGDAMDTTEG